MRLLVTGATGFVGRYVLEEGRRLGGVHVTAVVRNRAIATELAARYPEIGVTVYDSEWSFHSHPAKASCDVLVNLVGPRSVRLQDRWEANVEFVRSLICRLMRSGSVPRIVHLSSAAIYGAEQGGQTVVSEDGRIQPIDSYGWTKVLGEMMLLRFHKHTATPVTVLRPTWVIGVGSRLLDAYIARARSVGVKPIFDLHRHLNFVYVRDLARAILRAATFESPGFSAYNINTLELVTYRELVDAFFQEIHPRPITAPIPSGILEVVSWRYRFFVTFLHGPFVNASKIQRELGFSPAFSLQDIVKDMAVSAPLPQP